MFKIKYYENWQNDHQWQNILVINHILSSNSLRKCMEISIENLSVEAFTYRRSWRARRARRSLKNKLNQLVFMQFNFIPSGSLVRFSLAFFQSRLYPDKLEVWRHKNSNLHKKFSKSSFVRLLTYKAAKYWQGILNIFLTHAYFIICTKKWLFVVFADRTPNVKDRKFLFLSPYFLGQRLVQKISIIALF